MNFQKKAWKYDPRSKKFSHTRFFGAAVTVFPDTLNRPLTPPEDQGNTLRCAAYAGAVDGCYIHGQRFSPDWQTDKIGRIQGNSVDVAGSNPDAAMKSQVYPSGGYLPYAQWDMTKAAALDATASNFGDSGYVTPDGGKDIFDSIKSALVLAYDQNIRLGACVQAFGQWFSEWTYTEGGIIPTTYTNLAGYHSYLFVDFCTINGVMYLMAQNSGGLNMGFRGMHFFPREVVNREFSKPNTMIKIPKPLTDAQIALAKQETSWGAIQRLIISAWYEITNIYNS